ncbi:MAG: adenylate/guanylate cyclase domain-containing protein [Thermoplasmata archaeon]|nr:MAG: adenylate/guanylate cyclase domain-containing protein [Thermoplasmata archaeon]
MTGVLKNKLTKTLLVSLFIPAIVALIMTAGFFNTWESIISDALYAPGDPLDEIVIVAIDDYSFRKLGMFPWPRGHFAKVIENINQSSVIGIDITFDLATDTENDSELAASLKTGKVVLAIEYTSFFYRDGELYGESLLKPNATLGTPGVDFETGFVNLYTDSDGVTRSFTPHISGVEDHDHFSMVIVGEYLGITPDLGNSRMLINFFAPPEGYEYISFYDVYNKSIPSSYFKGKIVLIGITSPVEHDDAIVPISNKAMPGVEINANLVQSILTRDFLYYQDDISAICTMFLFALLTGILLFRFRMHIATILLAALAIAYIFASVIYTFNSGIIMNILYPLLSITMVYIPIVVIYYRTEEKSRKWITSVFGKYVSPVVIDNLIKNPDRIKLGGEKRNITIFFSDIRGFTPISEKLDPEELVRLLNEYLTEMTSIIRRDRGLVDKYMGDAIMAFWGAPLDLPDHAEMACSSCLDMMDKLGELQKKWKKEGIPSFNIGIGLNSGDAIVGNMGSFDRFDYTALGDNVNLASRMEGLNKLYGTNIIITENTHKIVKDKFEFRKLDAVKVKGKKKPILIYELLSGKDKLSKKQRDFVRHYEAGLEFYFKKKWKPAIKSFQAALKLMDDNAAYVFITRCQEFIKNPPLRDWDGVWEIETK